MPKRWIDHFVLLALILVCAPRGANAQSTSVIDDPVYLNAQRLIDIGHELRLNLYCTGRGSPAVIFDSGLGDSNRVWGLVQPVIAAHTRACSYDRAGLGFSDPGPLPRSSARAVEELHRLLQVAGVKPPYILVGHSLGGLNMRLYAETYLPQVAGMVYVDATHEEQGKRVWALDPEGQKQYATNMAKLRRCLETPDVDFVPGSDLSLTCIGEADPHFSAAINAVELERAQQHGRMAAWISEQDNVFFASSDQVRAAHRRFGDIPLIALTHSPRPPAADETQTSRDLKNQMWIDLHGEMASMSTCGMRWTVEHSGHYIQWDQPQVVITSILDVLKATRSKLCAMHDPGR